MTGVGIAYGIIGAATIAACVHMIDQGYAWWQVLLMAALGYAILPSYTRRTNDERDRTRA